MMYIFKKIGLGLLLLLAVTACGAYHDGELPLERVTPPIDRHVAAVGVYSPEAVLQGQIGTVALTAPTGVVIDQFGNLFIIDSGNRRIIKLDSRWQLVNDFRVPGEGFSWLNGLGQAAVSKSGELYIADTWSRSIVHLDGLLRPLPTISLPDVGQFSSPDFAGRLGVGTPSGVAFSNLGELFIVDRQNNVIFRFESFGQTLIGEGFGQPGALLDPHGIAVDQWGTLFVCDSGNRRIAVYDATGRFQRAFGGGLLRYPIGVALDQAQNIYVVDRERLSVVIFDPSGKFISELTDFGQPVGALSDPIGVALDIKGRLIIADTGNNRIVICYRKSKSAP